MEWTAGFTALGFGIGKDLEGDSPGVGREVSLSLMMLTTTCNEYEMISLEIGNFGLRFCAFD